MFIKEFVESYSNFTTQNLKDNYLKDNLEITTYVPFVKKVTYAASLAQNTMIDKDTGNVRVSSESNYLFFVRSIIELYTDLEIENNAFYDEYDLLNESGLLDKIMQMIPEREINEFKMICDMKKDDIISFQHFATFISNNITQIIETVNIPINLFVIIIHDIITFIHMYDEYNNAFYIAVFVFKSVYIFLTICILLHNNFSHKMTYT